MYDFDLLTLWRTLLAKKKRIFINCGIAFVIGVALVFDIPRQYASTVSLASESKEGGSSGGTFGSLASLAGINLMNGNDAIGPELYPDVVSTNDFAAGLLSIPVVTADGSLRTTYLEYLRNHQKGAWWGTLAAAPGLLIKTILPKPKETVASKGAQLDPQRLSLDDEKLLEGIKGSISCAVDKETDIITITARAQDPFVAKQIVDTVTVHLQQFITRYRTNKARTDLDYYKTLAAEAHARYQKAQATYADYCDAHQDISLQSFITKRESLENELQLAFNNYSQLAQQVQLAEAKVQERTPAFTIIEKATVPNKHVAPKKMTTVIAFVFFALLGTLAWIYLKLFFSPTLARMNGKKDNRPTEAECSGDAGSAPAAGEEIVAKPAAASQGA